MKKRLFNLFIILSIILFIYLALFGEFNWECLFKRLFNISCPGCGLTRCFMAILNFDLSLAFRYNFLGIPLFILCLIYIIFLIRDIFINDNYSNRIIVYLFRKYYIVIVILLLVSMIVNNVNGI